MQLYHTGSGVYSSLVLRWFCFYFLSFNRTSDPSVCQCVCGDEWQCGWTLGVLGARPGGLWTH